MFHHFTCGMYFPLKSKLHLKTAQKRECDASYEILSATKRILNINPNASEKMTTGTVILLLKLIVKQLLSSVAAG